MVEKLLVFSKKKKMFLYAVIRFAAGVQNVGITWDLIYVRSEKKNQYILLPISNHKSMGEIGIRVCLFFLTKRRIWFLLILFAYKSEACSYALGGGYFLHLLQNCSIKSILKLTSRNIKMSYFEFQMVMRVRKCISQN